jgi:hypothetical protein
MRLIRSALATLGSYELLEGMSLSDKKKEKMVRIGWTTPASRTKMPLPSIQLAIGRVGCGLCVPELSEKITIECD